VIIKKYDVSMFKYEDYVLNEAKKSELNVGAIAFFPKDYRQYLCKGKVAIIESIKGNGDNIKYTLKMQMKDEDLPKYSQDGFVHHSLWKAFEKKPKYQWVDTITISKDQALKLIILDDEYFKLWKKSRLINFESSSNFEKIIQHMAFKIRMPLVDTSFVDISSSNSGVTYVPFSKYKTEIKDKSINPYQAAFRQEMKVGKILKKLDPTLTEAELEDSIFKYKTAYKIIIENANERIRVVTGEEIRYWYHYSRYENTGGLYGSLHGSCMRYQVSQRRFNIYCENKDLCAMAIYTNNKNELLARALIWKLDNGDVYMDRIYSIRTEDERQLNEYAKKLKMKSYYNGDFNKIEMEITLKKDFGNPSNNPYMDTFKWFDIKNLKLVNMVKVEKDRFGNMVQDKYKVYTSHD